MNEISYFEVIIGGFPVAPSSYLNFTFREDYH